MRSFLSFSSFSFSLCVCREIKLLAEYHVTTAAAAMSNQKPCGWPPTFSSVLFLCSDNEGLQPGLHYKFVPIFEVVVQIRSLCILTRAFCPHSCRFDRSFSLTFVLLSFRRPENQTFSSIIQLMWTNYPKDELWPYQPSHVSRQR